MSDLKCESHIFVSDLKCESHIFVSILENVGVWFCICVSICIRKWKSCSCVCPGKSQRVLEKKSLRVV